jgi:hypothetical protein
LAASQEGLSSVSKYIYGVFFKSVDVFMALCFTGTGAPQAARCKHILPIMFGMKEVINIWTT